MGKFDDMAMGWANGAIGAGMGLVLGDINDKRQLRQQERLSEQQLRFSKRAAEFNQQQQYDMWLKTNYGAQKDQMKKAGLSPGLMYGMSGGGGATVGGSNASVSGGGAPSGGGESMGMMRNALDMALLKAQKENIEADTANKRASASKTATDEIGSGLSNERAQLEFELEGQTYEARKERIKIETNKALQELHGLRNDNIVKENTTGQRIDGIIAEMLGLELKNELTRVQTEKGWNDIKIDNKKLELFVEQNKQAWEKLSLDERNVKVGELMSQFNMSLSREAFGAIGGVISQILGKFLGGKK